MTSQILAIFYLNDVDHFIKENLKCKYYIRYMDDLIILDYDYAKLKSYLRLIRAKINDVDLEINNKSNIHKLSEGFSFIGYTFRTGKGLSVKSRNKTVYRIHRHLKNLQKKDLEKYNHSLDSYKGYFKHSDRKLNFEQT